VVATGSMGSYTFNTSAVGEETYCDKNDPRSETLFAWEFNVLGRRRDGVDKKGAKYVPTDSKGKRVDWYGCMNSNCCDVLKSWIAANRSYFLAVAMGMFILLALGMYISLKVATNIQSNPTTVTHGRDMCIGIAIGLLLVLGGIASIYMSLQVPRTPQKSKRSIELDKNITSDLPTGSNETATCRSVSALDGDGTCVSCFNGIQDGGEAGIDCGGSCRARCQSGQTCVSALPANRSDCALGLMCREESGVCSEETNVDVCLNGVLDGGEACMDGGYACANVTGRLCGLSETCKIDGDCESSSCWPNKEGISVCISCTDGTKTGRETDGEKNFSIFFFFFFFFSLSSFFTPLNFV